MSQYLMKLRLTKNVPIFGPPCIVVTSLTLTLRIVAATLF